MVSADTRVYIAAGGLAVAVFVVGIAALVTLTAVELTRRELAMFAVGFSLFMGVYFVAMAVYRGIEG